MNMRRIVHRNELHAETGRFAECARPTSTNLRDRRGVRRRGDGTSSLRKAKAGRSHRSGTGCSPTIPASAGRSPSRLAENSSCFAPATPSISRATSLTNFASPDVVRASSCSSSMHAGGSGDDGRVRTRLAREYGAPRRSRSRSPSRSRSRFRCLVRFSDAPRHDSRPPRSPAAGRPCSSRLSRWTPSRVRPAGAVKSVGALRKGRHRSNDHRRPRRRLFSRERGRGDRDAHDAHTAAS